jgi:hypothetical protein
MFLYLGGLDYHTATNPWIEGLSTRDHCFCWKTTNEYVVFLQHFSWLVWFWLLTIYIYTHICIYIYSVYIYIQSSTSWCCSKKLVHIYIYIYIGFHRVLQMLNMHKPSQVNLVHMCWYALHVSTYNKRSCRTYTCVYNIYICTSPCYRGMITLGNTYIK